MISLTTLLHKVQFVAKNGKQTAIKQQQHIGLKVTGTVRENSKGPGHLLEHDVFEVGCCWAQLQTLLSRLFH